MFTNILTGVTISAFTTVPSTFLSFNVGQPNFPLQAWFAGNFQVSSGAGTAGATAASFDIRLNIDGAPGPFVSANMPTAPWVVALNTQHVVLAAAGSHTLWLEWRRTSGGRIGQIENGAIMALGWS
jgi:hypothetical protein